MNIIFAGSQGKTGSVVYNYLLTKGYSISHSINEKGPPLSSFISPHSIIIDFTIKDVAINHAKLCLENNCHFICGTTGIDKEIISNLTLQSKNKNLKFIFCPNFSIGLQGVLKSLEFISNNYNEALITESHHISKKDLPSGTSLLLKEIIGKNTTIDSIRTSFPSLKHTIILKNDYEQLEITHCVHDKRAYAAGVEKSLKTLLNELKYD